MTYCIQGVVKTHRLLLMASTLMIPTIQDSDEESSMTIGPKTMKNIIDHFPMAKNGKADPQLIWTFRASSVEIKSREKSRGT
jgi:cell cycle checkpoint control protein RAD9A